MYIELSNFAINEFPENMISFSHFLSGDPLLTLEELIKVTKELPPGMVEFINYGGKKLSVTEIVSNIRTSSSWLIFRNLEQLPKYESLMSSIIQELRSMLSDKNDFHNPMCFVFLSSPSVKTPFHIDPEHNFLFQITGSKIVKINNHKKKPIISDQEISDFYKDEVGYPLKYSQDFEEKFESFNLYPSTGVYIPVTYPHLVLNGSEVSISLSVTFRTELSEKNRLALLNK